MFVLSKKKRELLLNFLLSEDDYVEVSRLSKLAALRNCYVLALFYVSLFYLLYSSVFTVI